MYELENKHFYIEEHTGGCACPACGSEFVRYGTLATSSKWLVAMVCGNCQFESTEVVEAKVGRRIDGEKTKGMDALKAALKGMVEANMDDYALKFEGALESGAILPDDFDPAGLDQASARFR
jgi:transcription elongation factor Elf1